MNGSSKKFVVLFIFYIFLYREVVRHQFLVGQCPKIILDEYVDFFGRRPVFKIIRKECVVFRAVWMGSIDRFDPLPTPLLYMYFFNY